MAAKKRILFVCVGNCCRSQMAEGFARYSAGDLFDVFSAGSKPAGYVHPEAVKVMAEVGIDIANQSSKGFHELPYKQFDYMVSMGCGVVCPFYPSKEKIEWQIEDPMGKKTADFRRVRDEIERKVDSFLSSVNP
jgi:arsenate reductase